MWLHRGHRQLLLGRKPDPTRGWTPVPHDRYTVHRRLSLSLWPRIQRGHITINYVSTGEKRASRRRSFGFRRKHSLKGAVHKEHCLFSHSGAGIFCLMV